MGKEMPNPADLASTEIDASEVERIALAEKARDFLDRTRIRPDETFPETMVCLSIYSPIADREVPVCHRGDFSVVSGPAKVGKTFVIRTILTAMLGNRTEIGRICGSLAPGKDGILWFDTEQSRRDVKTAADGVMQALGVWDDRLQIVPLRQFKTAERRQWIEVCVRGTDGVGVVVIDGIKDLMVKGINDTEESTDIGDLLLNLTAERDIHLVTVLHTNKTDGNLRGHIGSEIGNKAQTVFALSKQSDESNGEWMVTVEGSLTRGKPFEPFSFKIEDGRTVETYTPPKAATRKTPAKGGDWAQTFQSAFKYAGKDKLTKRELGNALIGIGKIKSERSHNIPIDTAVFDGILCNDTQGRGGLYWLAETT